MDYANIYSFIHGHELDADAVREVAFRRRSDGPPQGVDGRGDGDDDAKAMAHFASPGTIVIGNQGYGEQWMCDHTVEEWEAEDGRGRPAALLQSAVCEGGGRSPRREPGV